MTEHLSMDMPTKFQIDIFQTSWVLLFWMPHKATFYAIYEDCGIFRFSNCVRFGPFRCVLWSFLRSWRKSDLKTCITPSKPEILNLTFFDLVTSDDSALTRGHKRLGRYFKVAGTRSMSFHRLYFNLIWLLCPVMRAWQMLKSMNFDPTCDAISYVQTKFCKMFEKFKMELSISDRGSIH